MSKKINFLIDVDASSLALPLESTSSGDGGGTDLGTVGGVWSMATVSFQGEPTMSVSPC